MHAKSEGKNGKKGRIILIAILGLVLFSGIIMAINSRKPAPIVLEDEVTQTKGAAFTRTNLLLVAQIQECWLPNDLFWPTALLDNMPNYQIGLLEVIRYNVRVMRDNLSRMRTTDKLDPHVEGAFTALSNDPYKWWFPSAESKWKLAHERLDAYNEGLVAGTSHFYPRADNLVQLLDQYASLMGGANTRLINAPRDVDEVLAVNDEEEGSSETGKMVGVDIPWHLIDNNFYYAQGISYGLYQSFKAIRMDFEDVLKDKNCLQLVDKILEDLRRCDFEPLFIFNGDPESMVANHSLNLSGIFNDSRQKINSLISALIQG